jgi:dTDP-4-amino-4,6-dideoxygalactose transaminase
MKIDSRLRIQGAMSNLSQNASVMHVGCPNIGDRRLFDQLVDEMFQQRWFTNNGRLVQQFEAKLCEYLGVKHCISVCNATIGLQIVCRALRLTGEVILPAFTFVATAHAVEWIGLKSVFADVDQRTHNLDPASVASLITDRTSAILGVHVWGRPCDTDALERLAARHSLSVFYDAAHAFGCKQKGRMIGNFGQCEVFSFHATKFFNTFEGGAIATNDDALAERIRRIRNFGFTGQEEVIDLGTNAKMPEISAAMGLANFARVDHFLTANRENHTLYREMLSGIVGIQLLDFADLQMCNWQYVVVKVDENTAGITRDTLVDRLRKHDILARRYFFPGCHQLEPYRSKYPEYLDKLPVTDMLCRQILCLPTGTSLGRSEISRVVDAIREILNQS